MSRLRREGHASCVACIHPELCLNFSLTGPDRIHSSIDFTETMCSFNGHVHGGILAFVVDEAVTCLLMSQGKYAVTGDLKLRYRQPVAAGQTAHVEAWLTQVHSSLSKVEAVLRQGGEDCVLTKASMMEEGLL